MNKTVLITGASSGIGEACADIFAQNKYKLVLVARRTIRLQTIKERLEKEYEADLHIVAADLTKRSRTIEFVGKLPEDFADIDVLVNNAGLALGLNPIQEGELDDWETMIDTNVKGLLYITRALLPKMIRQNKGHIINIGSIAGRDYYPGGNVYSATKAAVDALTRSMRMDLLGKGIRVTQIAPGAVETEFSLVRFEGDAHRASQVYKNYQPLKAEDIASIVYYVTTLPGHVNINDIQITALDQASSLLFNK